jgi:hypothetical protein
MTTYRKGSAAGASLKNSTGLMKIKHMDYVLSFREDLANEQAKEIDRKLKAEIADVCNQIIDLIGRDEYKLWWESAPEHKFLEAAKQKLAQILAAPVNKHIRHCLTYAGRFAPGKFCPRCGLQLSVNEKEFKTTNPDAPHYERRLTCPGFFTTGCRHREAFTIEVQNLIDAEAAARENAPAEF